jgi:hypothetical protein
MPVKVYDGTNWVTVAGDGAAGAPGAPGTSSSINTWVKTASGGETSVSGTGDTGYGTLAYTVGQELVYLNGVLLDRGDDYTATNGTSITGLTALTVGDVVTVWTVNSFSVANTYTQAQANAAFAPIGQGMTLLSTTTTNSGTTVQTVSGISTAYKSIKIIVTNLRNNGGVTYQARLNGDTGSNYIQGYSGQYWAGYDGAVARRSTIILGNRNSNQTDWARQGYGVFDLYNYNTAGQCIMQYTSFNHDDSTNNDTFTFTEGIVVYNASAAVTSFSLIADSNFTSGTIFVYGVN